MALNRYDPKEGREIQIAESSDVQAAKSQVVASLNAAVAEINEDIEGLETSLETLETNLGNEIDEAVEDLEGKITENFNATSAELNQVPTADGNGGWSWKAPIVSADSIAEILTEEDYDSNGVPTLSNPLLNRLYLVPSGSEEKNLYVEWIYKNNDWERVGSSDIDLTNYAQKTDLASANPSGNGTTVLDKILINGVVYKVVKIPTGGSQGQILSKKTGTDYDVEWVTPTSVPTDTHINGLIDAKLGAIENGAY